MPGAPLAAKGTKLGRSLCLSISLHQWGDTVTLIDRTLAARMWLTVQVAVVFLGLNGASAPGWDSDGTRDSLKDQAWSSEVVRGLAKEYK